MTPKRKALWDALDKVVDRYAGELDQAQRSGRIREEGRVGVAVASLLRGIDFMQALPDDRELTDDEVDRMQAALIQIQTASLFLLEELPFGAMGVAVAAFDTSKPQ